VHAPRLLSVTAAAVTLTACGPPPTPRTPLVQDAQVNHGSQDDTVLRRRLLARFPLGSPEAGLPGYLRAQGFEIRRLTNVGETGDQAYGEASLRWGNPINGRRARVFWRASKDGALIELGVIVDATGLLGELGNF